jgi:hypothetical protein
MVDDAAAGLFFGQLASGVDLSDGDPILALRRMVIRVNREDLRVKPYEWVFYLVLAWQKWRAGEGAFRLVAPRGGVRMEHIPLLVDCGRVSGDED